MSAIVALTPLNYLYGHPDCSALIRSQPDDFRVVEELNFTPTGEGEHLLLLVEKTGQNTQFVARELAQLTGLRMRDISYAGLKDRHAVTQQWFCFKWPIKQDLVWQEWELTGARILKVVRHSRKLRLGALKRNHFTLRLREVTEPERLISRLDKVASGVPNYYGEQRFGINGGNLALAERLFGGESIPDRQLRGLALSASRSFLFNQVVSIRIQHGIFVSLIPGDVVQLAGSGSIFKVPEVTQELTQRLLELDIHVTAPLVGLGQSMTSADAARLEQECLAPWQGWQIALEALRVQSGRRSIRVVPEQLQAQRDNTSIVLQFALPAGCFATSVLRELVQYRDVARDFAPMEC